MKALATGRIDMDEDIPTVMMQNSDNIPIRDALLFGLLADGRERRTMVD